MRASSILETVDFDKFAREGAVTLGDGAVASAQPAAEVLDRLFEGMRADGRVKTNTDARKGQFLITVASGEDLLALPEVRDFVLGDEVLGLATRYFGEVPVLSGVGMKWSPPNDQCEESQLYHYDGEDKTQLKVFLNVKDIDQTCGPFTYVTAEHCAKLPQTKRHSARVDDDLVEKTAGADAVRRVMGPQGTVSAVDTSRCMHYGSRGNSRERVMLFVQFNRFLAPKAQTTAWRVGDDVTGADQALADLRGMVMDLR